MGNFSKLHQGEINTIKKAAKFMKLPRSRVNELLSSEFLSKLLLKCLRECEQTARRAGICGGKYELMIGCEMFADELRIKELEDEGMTRSDAQGILILEEMKNKAAR